MPAVELERRPITAPSLKTLLEEYQDRVERGERPPRFDYLKLETQAGRLGEYFGSESEELIFYNPSKPIVENGQFLIAVRVEPKESENSLTFFFQKNPQEEVWRLAELPPIELQDPFFLGRIEGKQIFGGVKTFPDPADPHRLAYQTAFWQFEKHLSELIDSTNEFQLPFFVGPVYMKGLRLIQLKEGRIGVFSRPQGGSFGPGQIAYTEISSLSDLSEAKIRQSNVVLSFAQNEWGGVNDLCLLEDGRIGVIGHIASLRENKKYYCPVSFIFNPLDTSIQELKILAVPPPAPFLQKAKNPNIGAVVYPSGYLVNPPDETGKQTGTLFAGFNDVASGEVLIEHPFK